MSGVNWFFVSSFSLLKTTFKRIIYGFFAFHMGKVNKKLIVFAVKQLFSNKFQHIFSKTTSPVLNPTFYNEMNSPCGQDAYKHILQRNFIQFFCFFHFTLSLSHNHQLLLFECYQKCYGSWKLSIQLDCDFFSVCGQSQFNSTLLTNFFFSYRCCSVETTFFHFTFWKEFQFVFVFFSCPNSKLMKYKQHQKKEKSIRFLKEKEGLLTLWIGSSNDIFQKCVLWCDQTSASAGHFRKLCSISF